MTTCKGSAALATHSLMIWRIMLSLRSSALMWGSQRMGVMGSMLIEDLMASLRCSGPTWNLRIKRAMSGAETNVDFIICQSHTIHVSTCILLKNSSKEWEHTWEDWRGWSGAWDNTGRWVPGWWSRRGRPCQNLARDPSAVVMNCCQTSENVNVIQCCARRLL